MPKMVERCLNVGLRFLSSIHGNAAMSHNFKPCNFHKLRGNIMLKGHPTHDLYITGHLHGKQVDNVSWSIRCCVGPPIRGGCNAKLGDVESIKLSLITIN